VTASPSDVRRQPGKNKEEGQVLPALLLLVVALVAIAVALLPIGEATDMRAHAQTAADAAALAGAEDLVSAAKASLSSRLVPADKVAPTLVGAAALSGADPCGAADQYAGLNGATMTDCTLLGRDVLVTVKTDEVLRGKHSEEQARATLSVTLPPSSKAALASLLATATTTTTTSAVTTTTLAGQTIAPWVPLVDPLQYLQLRARLVPLGG
jgi:Putative Flp pilus-assembly TadE/G-like